MRKFALLLLVLGLSLVSVGTALSQPPGGRPGGGGRGDGLPPHHEGRGPRGDRGPDDSLNQGGGQGQVLTAATTQTTPATTAAQTISPNPLLGGGNTVFDDSPEAFTNPLPGLSEAQMLQFDEGDELFEQAFIAATGGGDSQEDGLGPLFNATSCEGCHIEDGRGRAPLFLGEDQSGFLIRLALEERDLTGATTPDPVYGGQLQDMSIGGIPAEAEILITYTEVPGTFADGTPYSLRQPAYTLENLGYGEMAAGITFSPRVANQMIGLGMLEAISEDTLLAWADPNDSNGDGVSGRPNYVWDAYNSTTAIGRFGWKANQPHLLQQTAGAYNGDIGISTSLFPHQQCGALQSDCAALPTGGEPEISDEHLLLVVFYSQTLSVPAQRNSDDPQVMQGEALFMEAQCNSCHVSEVTTGVHPSIPQLSNQTIRPFTDLLLHDMGPGLADNQSDFQATGSEWRTPPLWGIGLFETVNGHTTYLHDGRARDLNEAILWHGGEAAAAQAAYLNMTAEEREALLAFLKSL